MKCDSVQMNITSYQENSLHPIRMKEIETHLEECVACREWYQEVLELETIWNNPALPALEEDLTVAIMTAISSRPLPYRRNNRFNPLLKTALASGCALILFMYNGAEFFYAAASHIGNYNEHFAHSISSMFHNLSGNS
ncbi:putative anti-sigma-YlaC factor YlaD [Paenibacillus endophyticus]|uniref:Putative anti-sigma-YlaC factor YlaD n=1 Tax=Paenibacillus endophyticus TaxID=1294268 RepID=A0A7W5CE91_9BACL|nr:zf-HC2 domain-containing protein [Paenibacillus endophyticus]MBB3155640.1 putative anti-sigma-YlaC factor YlaD [Paenibacillus endophyticus]